MKKKKKINVEEILEEIHFNDTYLKKLYHLYIHQTIFDKILDILVLIAIIFTIMAIIMKYAMHLSDDIMYIVNSISTLILVVFIFDLTREYATSKTKRHFIKKHWIDVVLLVILSFYFVFVSYLGIAKFKFLTSTNKYVKEMKNYRVIKEFFTK